MRGKGALIRVHHLTIFTFFLFSPPVLFYALAMDRQAGPIRITQEHLVAALRETRPSVSASERQQYDRMYVNFQAEKSRERMENGQTRNPFVNTDHYYFFAVTRNSNPAAAGTPIIQRSRWAPVA